MERDCGGLNRTTCTLQFSPRGRTPPWSHGPRLEAILNLAQKKIWWPWEGFYMLGNRWYFVPYSSSGAYNPAHAREGGWICQEGAQPLQEMKLKLIYFMHFRGGKRITWTHWGWSSAWFCSIPGLGVGCRTPFPLWGKLCCAVTHELVSRGFISPQKPTGWEKNIQKCGE